MTLLAGVPFGGLTPDPDGVGHNAVLLEPLGYLSGGDRLAPVAGGPGFLLIGAEKPDQFGRGDPVPVLAEDLLEVGQEFSSYGLHCTFTAGNFQRGRGAELQPLGAGCLGNRQERLPVILGPIMQTRGEWRPSLPDLVVVIFGKARQLGAQLRKESRFGMAEAVHLFMGQLPPQGQDYGPIHQGVGQVADPGQGLGTPGGELGRGETVANSPDHIGALPGMAAVEQPAQLLVVFDEGVSFVDQ